MSPLLGLLIVWGALMAVLIVLLIYRSTLSMHRDEQLFLDESSSHMAQEQMEVMKKVDKIKPLVRVFGAASGALILVIAGIWVYQSWTAVQ
jgi:Tfp pilus assembly protein PilN